MGLRAVVIPLFEICPIDWHAPDAGRFDGLLLTSGNAVRAGGAELDRLRQLPAHCVGEITANAARNAGFDVATVGNGGVDALLDSLPPYLKLLHLCGADRRDPASRRQGIEPLMVYQSVELPVEARLANIEHAVVALHSPRAAAAVARAALKRDRIALAAISDAAAEAAGAGWETIAVAAEPTDAALLAIAARLCNNAA